MPICFTRHLTTLIPARVIWKQESDIASVCQYIFETIEKYCHPQTSESNDNFFKESAFLNSFYLFLERGEGKERKGENHQCVVASHTLYWGPGLQPRYVP